MPQIKILLKTCTFEIENMWFERVCTQLSAGEAQTSRCAGPDMRRIHRIQRKRRRRRRRRRQVKLACSM
jgi:hypothetical protein